MEVPQPKTMLRETINFERRHLYVNSCFQYRYSISDSAVKVNDVERPNASSLKPTNGSHLDGGCSITPRVLLHDSTTQGDNSKGR